mgnify:CR=1 FL=1
MKNTFGNSLSVTLFGESHGEVIGAVLDGIAPGIAIDEAYIAHRLALRRPAGKIATARREGDPFRIVSGVFGGKTTGTPLTVLIPNENTNSKDYSATRALARPGHADYTAFCKYHGYEDYRGGGHFSGRVTTGIVAAAGIIIPALRKKGIIIGSHISSLGGVFDRAFGDFEEDAEQLYNTQFPVLDSDSANKMQSIIESVSKDGDSIGGVLETVISGLPAGLGEPFFDSMESMISHAVFSIPAVKGIEFGAGFNISSMLGSEANDSFVVKGDDIVTKTNNNGGINGGITNGMPLIFRCAVKPTPSIYKEQNTIDMRNGENTTLQIQGRHDPAIVHRARVVVDSITALTLIDLLCQKYGADKLIEKD